MNEEFRKYVDEYLGSESVESTEPLGFYNQKYNNSKFCYDYKPVEVTDLSIKELGLTKAIINTLDHTRDYASGINNHIETGPLALRSALDIWRHIKKYNPEISIYEVMKCIADNHERMGLYSHFCCTIDRRVFVIADDDEYEEEINDDEEQDEFGLYFSDWSEL